ncbi:MAG TPA: hypothetical protein VFV71_06485 [Burkholderiales bacterium]|nr:hypothetical protein [Burkholderiales bacterium]
MSTTTVGPAAEERFEYATAEDHYFNYCLWPYRPVAPAEDKFRGINVLYQSFDFAGADPRAYGFCEAIRDAIGPFQTVFGIKQIDGRMGWEFYFYDYLRKDRKVSIGKVLAAIAPFARCEVRPNEKLPYFMFSIDVDSDLVSGRRELDVVHMYVGNVGSKVSSGIAYALRPRTTTLENFYFFFDAKTQLAEAADKICCSAFVDVTRINIDRILWPELRDCRTICVANKQHNDCVYFSEINVDQLLFFLKALAYPAGIVRFFEENRASLDHLLYDVGIDYRVEGSEVRVLKSGYYNVF